MFTACSRPPDVAFVASCDEREQVGACRTQACVGYTVLLFLLDLGLLRIRIEGKPLARMSRHADALRASRVHGRRRRRRRRRRRFHPCTDTSSSTLWLTSSVWRSRFLAWFVRS
jgi:hypothetical protein